MWSPCGKDLFGECEGVEATGGVCRDLSKEDCWAKKSVCTWKCVRAPTLNQGDVDILRFMPGGEMPFNEKQKTIQKNCNIMAKEFHKHRFPFKRVMDAITYAYNGNEKNESFMPHSSKWGNQRNKCLNGIRKVYERPLKKPVRKKVEKNGKEYWKTVYKEIK